MGGRAVRCPHFYRTIPRRVKSDRLLGLGNLLFELRFVGRRCQARRFRLRFVADEVGEAAPLKMQWFRSANEKSQK